MSKGIYNSELVKRGEVAIKVLSEVKKSKFEGKPDFMFIELDGQERSLSSENPDYFDELLLHKDDVVTVKASGRGETAKLEILSGGNGAGEDGNIESAAKKSGMGTDHRTNPAPAQAPTVRSTSSNGAVRTLDTVATGFYAALGKADELVTQFFSDAQRESWSAYEAADLVLRVAAGLSIETNKNTR